KQRADKTVSLNEKQQLADRANIITQHKVRDEARHSEKVAESQNKVYDFTLAQAALPGLPAPTKQTNGVSNASDDLDADATPDAHDQSVPPDDLTEAVSAESEHAEKARMNEAENILMDYILLLKNGPKSTPTILAR